MIKEYIDAAMGAARYEQVTEGGQTKWHGTIPLCQGVWVHEDTLEEAQDRLLEVLEEWFLLGVNQGHELPKINGISLVIPRPS